jgi:catabolite regulation protein CreA
MYKHCSKEKRLHNGNKIFIVCYSSDGDHNQVKGNLQWVKDAIDNYIANYDEGELTIQDNSLSDIIFIVK